MAEQSFPVIEKPLTDDQWKSVTLGIGDGILDEGGTPYRVTVSNQTDQATVQTDSAKGYAHAILRGFYHRIDAPVALSVPAVSARTTYTIALQYDPTRSALPVKLGVFTGSLDRSNSKAYLVLATIVRDPSQLISDAKLTLGRQMISPRIQVDTEENLPDASTVLWGTQAHCWRTGTTLRASWNRWVPIGGQRLATWGMDGWSITTATNGVLARPTTGGWDCTVAGNIVRTAETYSIATGNDSVVGTLLPAEWRPDVSQWSIGQYRDQAISVSLRKTGQVAISPLSGSTLTITKGFSLSFAFSWFTSVDPASKV